LDPYIVRHYHLEVANDVFNGVGTSDLVVLPRHIRSASWHRYVGSPCTVAVPDEWSAALALHYSRLSTHLAGIVCSVYPHVL
jgi:hypothetical protein